MHLSRDEILDKIFERNSKAVYLAYYDELAPRACERSHIPGSVGRGTSPEAKPVEGGSVDRSTSIPAACGALYPEVRLHSNGSSCDITQGEINRLYFTWKESVVETSAG